MRSPNLEGLQTSVADVPVTYATLEGHLPLAIIGRAPLVILEPSPKVGLLQKKLAVTRETNFPLHISWLISVHVNLDVRGPGLAI